ncbi:2'-5' RNA ligase family protein [Aestuariirhabdus litorea]|uniref:RNA 2',3'-cyclic phosphodiesterase n=1 Tax=Aestuariirhabdus litorea TaxID=2528527 RepID=A0A3P3VPG4_9GAMM|nr:2'-5' RNA ligase family protein [Aestuariirhabdus litorea]RRJ84314.1 hypothetical protein D0544_04185 [Aestuariirhabdus litorea]RWW97537.1 hypothetical protein DZC74_04185 [Endozoicomonadaceae bacterium GTF-13]
MSGYPREGALRAFYSADLPAGDASAIADWVSRDLAPRFPEARWVPPENYHITLYFLGQVVASEIDGLIARLRSLDLTQAVAAATGDFIWLPSPTRPQVLALAVDSGGALEALASRLENPQPLLAHITLARRVRQIDQSQVQDIAPPRFTFASLASVSLRQSLSSPEGVRYPMLSFRRPGDTENPG